MRVGHRAGEAVDRGLLAEERLEVGLRDLARFERAEPLLQPQRAEERLLDGDLLVEREADEQRERILREQPVGRLVLREPERVGHGAILRGGLQQSAAALDVRRRPLLLEVRERGVESRRVAALGREQRRPRLGEAGPDLAVDLGGARELAGGGRAPGLEPTVARAPSVSARYSSPRPSSTR